MVLAQDLPPRAARRPFFYYTPFSRFCISYFPGSPVFSLRPPRFPPEFGGCSDGGRPDAPASAGGLLRLSDSFLPLRLKRRNVFLHFPHFLCFFWNILSRFMAIIRTKNHYLLLTELAAIRYNDSEIVKFSRFCSKRTDGAKPLPSSACAPTAPLLPGTVTAGRTIFHFFLALC